MGPGHYFLRRMGSIYRGAVDPERHRALSRIDRLDRVEGNCSPAPQKRIPPANHDPIGIVGMLLVANVIDHTDVPAIAREDEITRGGGETATQFGPLSRFAVVSLHRPLEHFPVDRHQMIQRARLPDRRL
jgi:hypothetical protein